MIIDSSGNEITGRPDYTLGRLVQGDEPGILVYKTWEEEPDLDDDGNVIDHTWGVSDSEKMDNMQEDIDMTQLALAEVYEMLVSE